jgi:hypothetical protein
VVLRTCTPFCRESIRKLGASRRARSFPSRGGWKVSWPVENNAIFIRHCMRRFYTKEKKINITSGLTWKSLYSSSRQSGSVANACPSQAVTLSPSKPRLPQVINWFHRVRSVTYALLGFSSLFCFPEPHVLLYRRPREPPEVRLLLLRGSSIVTDEGVQHCLDVRHGIPPRLLQHS